jgi:predicted RNase H-like HicB family nuclease
MSLQSYTYRVIWSPEDGEYVGLCAEFPSLSWLAKTHEAALRGIRKVVTAVAVDMLAHAKLTA